MSVSNQRTSVAPYPQEALLIDAIQEMAGEQVLCMSPGLAQLAGALAQALPQATVRCTYLDQYRASLAADCWQPALPNLQIECACDLAAEAADVVALPFSAGGEAELTRDLIQSGHERLRLGGKLYAATDNRKDTWLHEQLQKVFRKLDRRESAEGVLYVATKTEPLKKLKNFSCEFAFRDRGRLIRAFSRPGVFSHRHIDPGARHLIEQMLVNPGDHVLDIGCGAGTVALAVACRTDDVKVHAVDSNARAVECTQRGAELNELVNVTTELNAGSQYQGSGNYDLALGNPPYYSGYRIAGHFLAAGRQSLRPGGRMLIVTKRAEWYEQNMPDYFDDVTMTQRKGYWVFQGTRPPTT